MVMKMVGFFQHMPLTLKLLNNDQTIEIINIVFLRISETKDFTYKNTTGTHSKKHEGSAAGASKSPQEEETILMESFADTN